MKAEHSFQEGERECVRRLLSRKWDSKRHLKNIETLFRDRFGDLSNPVESVHLLSFFLENQGESRLAFALENPSVLYQLVKLFSISPAMGFLLNRHLDILESSLPLAKIEVQNFPRTLAGWMEKEKRQGRCPSSILRRYKLRAFVHIILSDYLDLDHFEETTEKISRTADGAMDYTLEAVSLGNEPVTVIAMGKWGASELNYHSDIDVLFVGNEGLSPEKRVWAERQIMEVVRLLGEPSEGGLVFPVDTRLRPEGSAGGILAPFSHYTSYYRCRARSWERQALIKARPVAGDRRLGEKFMKMAREEAYEWKLDPPTLLKEIAATKRRMEFHLSREDLPGQNVKLGVGGIRDIEFTVQFLQICHGQKTRGLREPSTLRALDRLLAHGILSGEEHSDLRKNYLFLRRVEHGLQLRTLRPIRHIPAPRTDEAAILSRQMGFKNEEAFLSAYRKSTTQTRRIFAILFENTVVFLNKFERIQGRLPPSKKAFANRFLSEMESDYLLHFSETDINRHIGMAALVLRDREIQIEFDTDSTLHPRITIVSWDFPGLFCNICGLLSVYGMVIKEGVSYISHPLQNGKKRAFYRRPGKIYSPSSMGQLEIKKLVVCSIQFEWLTADARDDFSFQSFFLEMRIYLRPRAARERRKSREQIAMKIIRRFPERPSQKNSMAAVHLAVDNDADPTYTILEIESEDTFMFLYEFTTALMSRNYYLGKIRIHTERNRIKDQLFLTTEKGSKIDAPEKIEDLKVTVTFIKTFAHYLRYAPNPLLALRQFTAIASRLMERSKGWEGFRLEEHETIFRRLARVLGMTETWENFLRAQSEALLSLLLEERKVRKEKTASDFRVQWQKRSQSLEKKVDLANALNDFKDKEMFRIDIRFITGAVKNFSRFFREITCLADVVMSEAFHLSLHLTERVQGKEPGVAALFSLGKWGGKEMGYASDLETLLLYDGGENIREAAYSWHDHFVREFKTLLKSKKDGIFELDFRLRPDGEDGPLPVSLNRFRDYYREGGSAYPFERQALIRLRPIAGDSSLIQAVIDHRDRYVYNTSPLYLGEMARLRERQQKEWAPPGKINVKYSKGGLVDAEYPIHFLQIRWGREYPEIRTTHTMEAVENLNRCGKLSNSHQKIWLEGYRFLSALINCLRIVRGNARDLVIPERHSYEFQCLVRRLTNFYTLPSEVHPWDYILDQMSRLHRLSRAILKPFVGMMERK